MSETTIFNPGFDPSDALTGFFLTHTDAEDITVRAALDWSIIEAAMHCKLDQGRVQREGSAIAYQQFHRQCSRFFQLIHLRDELAQEPHDLLEALDEANRCLRRAKRVLLKYDMAYLASIVNIALRELNTYRQHKTEENDESQPQS